MTTGKCIACGCRITVGWKNQTYHSIRIISGKRVRHNDICACREPEFKKKE